MTSEASGPVRVDAVSFVRAESDTYCDSLDGWNYTVRLYQPEPELLDGSWTFPALDQLR
jgi:hypothetical protein